MPCAFTMGWKKIDGAFLFLCTKNLDPTTTTNPEFSQFQKSITNQKARIIKIADVTNWSKKSLKSGFIVYGLVVGSAEQDN